MKNFKIFAAAVPAVVPVIFAATALTGCNWLDDEQQNYRNELLLNNTMETTGGETITTAFSYDEYGRKNGERQGVGLAGNTIYEDYDYRYDGLEWTCIRKMFANGTTTPTRTLYRVSTFDGSSGMQIKLEVYELNLQATPAPGDTPFEGWERTNVSYGTRSIGYDLHEWNETTPQGVTRKVTILYADDGRSEISRIETRNAEGTLEKTDDYLNYFFNSNDLTATYTVNRKFYNAAGEVTLDQNIDVRNTYFWKTIMY